MDLLPSTSKQNRIANTFYWSNRRILASLIHGPYEQCTSRDLRYQPFCIGQRKFDTTQVTQSLAVRTVLWSQTECFSNGPPCDFYRPIIPTWWKNKIKIITSDTGCLGATGISPFGTWNYGYSFFNR